MISGFIFLYSFSVCSSLVYRKVTDLCKLILYPVTLLKLFMTSRSFLVVFLGGGLVCIRSCHLQVGIICMPFISSSYLIALARNSKTILAKSRANGHTCLSPDFRGNGFSFSPFRMMLAIGLSLIALLCWSLFLLILVSSGLLSWRDVEFCRRFFLHLLRWLCVFCLCFS
jgi:hypothetical protein